MSKNLKISKKQSHYMLAACALLSVGISQPAQAEAAFGNASVTIRAAIQITEAQDMHFGTVIVNPADNDIITLSTNGTLSSNGNVEYEGNGQRSAAFSVTGAPNANLNITFTNASLTGDGDALTLNNFTHDAGSTPSFDGSGALVVSIGADLHLNNAQASGTYTGQYQMSVNYP